MQTSTGPSDGPKDALRVGRLGVAGVEADAAIRTAVATEERGARAHADLVAGSGTVVDGLESLCAGLVEALAPEELRARWDVRRRRGREERRRQWPAAILHALRWWRGSAGVLRAGAGVRRCLGRSGVRGGRGAVPSAWRRCGEGLRCRRLSDERDGNVGLDWEAALDAWGEVPSNIIIEVDAE
ncbi:MAG: hypothetical protein R3A48_28710 [Polyangiales bacterium]